MTKIISCIDGRDIILPPSCSEQIAANFHRSFQIIVVTELTIPCLKNVDHF